MRGALFPGLSPLLVALLASAIAQEPFPRTKKIGPEAYRDRLSLHRRCWGLEHQRLKHRPSVVCLRRAHLGVLYRRNALCR
jgi:hypothetical protein